MKIYKYKLEIVDEQIISLPEGSKVLSAKEQNGDICIWVLIDHVTPCENRTFYIFGTGNPILRHVEEMNFVGTVFTHDKALVWHVYEGGA